MASHIWGLERLQRNHLDQHIMLLVEDWNEPELGWRAGDSAILVEGATIVVTTPTTMKWMGDGPDTQTIVVGTYVGEELITCTCIDPSDAKIVYAPHAPRG